jgi:hypothetical protein
MFSTIKENLSQKFVWRLPNKIHPGYLKNNKTQVQKTLIWKGEASRFNEKSYAAYTENKTLLESSNKNYLSQFQVVFYLN